MKDLLLKEEARRKQFYAEESVRLMDAARREEEFYAGHSTVTGKDIAIACVENDLYYYNGFTMYMLTCVRGRFTDKFGNERNHMFVLYEDGKEIDGAFRVRDICEMEVENYTWVIK